MNSQANEANSTFASDFWILGAQRLSMTSALWHLWPGQFLCQQMESANVPEGSRRLERLVKSTEFGNASHVCLSVFIWTDLGIWVPAELDLGF
jgi:hypothetical protein